MALLNIIAVPDHRLRLQSRPVEEITPEIKQLAEDMTETMYVAPGVGLAAIQVAVPLNMAVVDPSAGEEPDQLITLINPRIVENSGRYSVEEGCLSVPGVYAEVDRFDKIVVVYQDLEGTWMELEAEGFLAIVIQHEMDHMKGKLFVDYLPSRDRSKMLRKTREFQREEALKARAEQRQE